MKTLLLDLNVLLDVILERQPGAASAARLWAAMEQGAGKGRVAGHGVTTIFHILQKARGAPFARQAVERLVGLFPVAPITDAVIHRALVFAWPDFEDAVSVASAEAAGCDAIVSRDAAGFPNAPLPVMDPAAALSWLGTSR